ncbi:hypothetical protein [Phaeovulum sp.]|uniref:hypothetical protein n=1 Tax=Phaeovulum sp. TaxID=2934796 RepID=UPI00273136E0|nr:hypothetical protein [Phaeovulum sp.]MDP1669962.1 hypothetical protein [Phaeovulum sp.]MDP2061992.1 hypothetical protein [Phaeovulum sp.]MDP3860953.1 hypothetical protein [Phaeovulum sp.]MDZ4118674.1 hypothetical protein [Phaeovulum sp.]
MNPQTLHQMSERVAQLMEERLKARGTGLRAKLAHRGRALPRKLRAEAELLVEAEARSVSPKLARQIDMERVSLAYDALVRHLKPIGASARRATLAVNLAATVVFVLVVTAAAVLAVMVWRDYL